LIQLAAAAVRAELIFNQHHHRRSAGEIFFASQNKKAEAFNASAG
jgi:hypothetical protein